MIEIAVNDLKKFAPELHAGDRIALTGTVYTARDAAHKRIFELLDMGEALPFELNGAVIYYTGPLRPKTAAPSAPAALRLPGAWTSLRRGCLTSALPA